MIINTCLGICRLLHRNCGLLWKLFFALVAVMFVALGIGKTYQYWDKDPERGAVAIKNGSESYSTPTYLDQGWDAADSLWFYNTTQGSGLIPYDFFLHLEQADSTELLRSNENIDKFRYLPQKKTFSNPDGLPVGIVKDTYQGKDYVGYTCAACHTGQVNFNGKAVRIDGGPAMADMVGFLTALQRSMQTTLKDPQKLERFKKAVIASNNDYSDVKLIEQDLAKWTNTIELYNTINHSHVEYGHARLDAFGRIYNRVLEHVINKEQLTYALLTLTRPKKNPEGEGLIDERLLTEAQVKTVIGNDLNDVIIGDKGFVQVLDRLRKELNCPEDKSKVCPNLIRANKAIFNEADAPVSYPYLWDVPYTDYVQWNALAANSTVGPLGRNTGEVIGVFGILDWKEYQPWYRKLGVEETWFRVSSWLTGESRKKHQIEYTSSIDLTNLERIESSLHTLKSPVWPTDLFGAIDKARAERGQLVYNEYCSSCHQVVDRDDKYRLLVANVTNVNVIGTDPKMVENSVSRTGYAGNFEAVYQSTDAGGNVVIQKRAPVVQILTAATKGTVATPDPDKGYIRRTLDWLYLIVHSLRENKIGESMKAGDYLPDTTANPYQSLLSYKARPLNGVWATAPYLHNGSVPNLYSLLLPKKEKTDVDGKYRPDEFCVGSREFDPVNVGFVTTGCDLNDPKDKNRFITSVKANYNTGHNYGTGKDGKDALTEQERLDLIEYIKGL